MEVSLIICTRKRAAQLAEALPHFAHLVSNASWEIVFLDKWVHRRHIRHSRGVPPDCPRMRVTITEERRTGLSVARMPGGGGREAALLSFTDDDCYPAVDYIDPICACFSEADLAYVGGRVLLFGVNDNPIGRDPHIRPGAMHAANFAFRRDALERAGGFTNDSGPARTCGPARI